MARSSCSSIGTECARRDRETRRIALASLGYRRRSSVDGTYRVTAVVNPLRGETRPVETILEGHTSIVTKRVFGRFTFAGRGGRGFGGDVGRPEGTRGSK